MISIPQDRERLDVYVRLYSKYRRTFIHRKMSQSTQAKPITKELYPLSDPQIVLLKQNQRQPMPHEQTKQSHHYLHPRDLHCQPVLPQRASPDQPQVQYCKVTRLHEPPLLIQRHPQQFHLVKRLQHPRHRRLRLSLWRPGRHARLQQSRARVKPR